MHHCLIPVCTQEFHAQGAACEAPKHGTARLLNCRAPVSRRLRDPVFIMSG